MNKKWGVFLIAAFALGFGLKKYMSFSTQEEPTSDINITSFIGPEQQTVDLFDPSDQRTRLVYFGFTHCPDVCPTSLSMLAAALNQIEESQLDNLFPVFITLDPERDTSERVTQYAHYFHPKLSGLTAPAHTIQAIAEKYGVLFQRAELVDSELQYTIDHNSYFYFLKPNGDLITKVPHTLNPAPLVAAINTLNGHGG